VLGVGQWQVTLKGHEQDEELWILTVSDGSPAMERQGSGPEPSSGR
jgi:hypothetical protein